MNILLDTGFLVALIVKPQNTKQIEQHETAKQMLKKHSLDDFHTVWECITEACHFKLRQQTNLIEMADCVWRSNPRQPNQRIIRHGSLHGKPV